MSKTAKLNLPRKGMLCVLKTPASTSASPRFSRVWLQTANARAPPTTGVMKLASALQSGSPYFAGRN